MFDIMQWLTDVYVLLWSSYTVECRRYYWSY